jgi:hypothetical protein
MIPTLREWIEQIATGCEFKGLLPGCEVYLRFGAQLREALEATAAVEAPAREPGRPRNTPAGAPGPRARPRAP